MSEWDQTGAEAPQPPPPKTPGWEAGALPDPAWGEPTLRGVVAGLRVFGRFVLERRLGQGGMGVVWLARDTRLEQEVALKFLPENIRMDPVAVVDLKRETQRALKLTHPNIVRVHDFHEDGTLAAIAMEYVEGASLSAVRAEQPHMCLEAYQLAPLMGPLCAALDYAHGEAKFVHRDIKPANLMVDGQWRVKITDFGIARSLVESMSRLSAGNSTSGTLVYMSPQQLDGEAPSPSDDIYSLGATIYELLTGKPPFYSGGIERQILEKVPPPMAERRAELGVAGEPIPAQWEAVVAACLEKEAAQRPGTAGEVVARLSSTFNNQHSTTNVQGKGSASAVLGAGGERRAPREERGTRKTGKRRGFVMAIGMVLASVGVGGWWYGLEAPRREGARAAEEKRLTAETARKDEGAREARQAEAQRLANARGSLSVTTEPAGALVSVDGGEAKAAPATFPGLKLGKHRVAASLEGYEPTSVEAEVFEDRVTEIGPLRLAAKWGSVQVESDPSGASVHNSGNRYLGKTPLTLERLAPGRVAYGIEKDGYLRAEVSGAVTAGGVLRLGGKLSPATGTVQVESEPPGAMVEDASGRIVGKAPVAMEGVAAGIVSYRLRKTGYREAEVRGEVGVGKILRLEGRLEGLMAGRRAGEEMQNAQGMSLCWCPAGEFVMGSPPDEEGHDDDEAQHRVVLTEGFWFGKYEVTQGEWQRMMGTTLRDQARKALQDDTLYKFPKGTMTIREFRGLSRDADPAGLCGEEDARVAMYWVSWEEAEAFCRRLTASERGAGRLPEGWEYRLPSEAQWEYACRAGTAEATYAGAIRILGENNAPILDAIAWYGGNSGVGYQGRGWDTTDWKEKQYPGGTAGPRRVGGKAANRWGLHDMLGNVWEWCADWYGDYPSGSVTDPTGPTSGSFRVERGGCWDVIARYCRSADRGWFEPGGRSISSGFRVAAVPTP